jgi:hypothetical protein
MKPAYEINDIVYLRESAALGFLEPVRISGISKRGLEWVYSVYAGVAGAVSAGLYGDRRSYVHGGELLFTESEFVTEYQAMTLSKTILERQLENVNKLILSKYPNGDET